MKQLITISYLIIIVMGSRSPRLCIPQGRQGSPDQLKSGSNVKYAKGVTA